MRPLVLKQLILDALVPTRISQLSASSRNYFPDGGLIRNGTWLSRLRLSIQNCRECFPYVSGTHPGNDDSGIAPRLKHIESAGGMRRLVCT